MEPIIKVEGTELTMLLAQLSSHQKEIHTLRFVIQDGAVKLKINSGVWSPPMGKVEK